MPRNPATARLLTGRNPGKAQRPTFRDAQMPIVVKRFDGNLFRLRIRVKGTRGQAQQLARQKFEGSPIRTVAVMGGRLGNKLLGFNVFVAPRRKTK